MTCPNCGTDCVPLPDELRQALQYWYEISDYDCGDAVYWQGEIEFVRAAPPFRETGAYNSTIKIRPDGSWEEWESRPDGEILVDDGDDFESLIAKV